MSNLLYKTQVSTASKRFVHYAIAFRTNNGSCVLRLSTSQKIGKIVIFHYMFCFAIEIAAQSTDKKETSNKIFASECKT